MEKRVLVIAPHPDDETLGCGGTLLKHRYQGDEIHWLIITCMCKSQGYSAKQVTQRKRELLKVSNKYGFASVTSLDIPTAKLSTYPESSLIRKVAEVLNRIQPNILYVPNRSDVHSDHRVCFDVAVASTKYFRAPFVRKILMYETLSETEFAPPFTENAFVPNTFNNISSFMAEKIAISKLYKGEVQKHPFPRSVENIRALAAFRGATTGVRFAEAFVLIKEIG
jgi:N-acetylglucosamine malate deacetylase 1